MTRNEHQSLTDDGPVNPPLRYHGGKWSLAPWIIPYFPAHRQYVEVFGGGAAVLLRKGRSPVEVYNDADLEIVNIFRLLRGAETRARLVELCYLTPFSREEFERAYWPESDEVQRAANLIARAWLGFAGNGSTCDKLTGLRTRDVVGRKSYAREWTNVPENLVATAERFRGVTIECMHFKELIPQYDHENSLLYCDPPYLRETRTSRHNAYRQEMSVQDHRHLGALLRSASSKVVVSGYASHLYDVELFPDWHRVEKLHGASGQKGAISRTEVLWMNF